MDLPFSGNALYCAKSRSSQWQKSTIMGMRVHFFALQRSSMSGRACQAVDGAAVATVHGFSFLMPFVRGDEGAQPVELGEVGLFGQVTVAQFQIGSILPPLPLGDVLGD